MNRGGLWPSRRKGVPCEKEKRTAVAANVDGWRCSLGISQL